MTIIIDGDSFTFDDESAVKTECQGYDLYVTEPDFDESFFDFSKVKLQFTSKEITLPPFVEARVSRVSGLQPCSKIFEDPEGRKKLHTYFD